MIAIVDYGMGNLLSVFNALQMLGAPAQICADPEALPHADRIILPGVGAFPDCMKQLTQRGFGAALDDAVRRRGRPLCGICLGMQALARTSSEGGLHCGLGWIEADVVRLTPAVAGLRVPQIGWNEVRHRPGSPLFAGLPARCEFYFVHSFWMKCDREEDVEATCDYGGTITAAVRKDNIFATQFHPEKSQDHGLQVLENFLRWNP
jgi:glutamine amidotransferase